MSPTVFDAENLKRQKMTKKLETQLLELKHQAEEASQPKTTMPEREESKARHPHDYSEVLRAEKTSNGLFSAFNALPPNVHFETQHEKEKILMVLRQHPIVNVKWIVITLLLIIAPLIVVPLLPFFDFLPNHYMFFLNLGWMFFILAYVIESFLGWYYNLYIITDERLIDVDFYSLIYRSISEAKLDKIEDVTATTAGVWGAMFDFGTITVQTAAEKREFELASVPKPSKVTKFLNELMLEEEREKLEGRVM